MPPLIHSPFQQRAKPTPGAILDRGHPLAKGLVSAWLFNESSGLPWDLIRNRFGTLTNTQYLGPQLRTTGTASTNGVDTGSTDNSFLAFSRGAIIFCYWPNYGLDSAERWMWGHGQGSSTPELVSVLYSDNKFYVGWNGSGDFRVNITANANNFQARTWQTQAFTWDASGSKLFLNGTQVGANTNVPTITNPSSNWKWGSRGGGAGNGLPTGTMMSYAYVYSDVIVRPDMIKALYDNPFGMFRGPDLWRSSMLSVANVISVAPTPISIQTVIPEPASALETILDPII